METPWVWQGVRPVPVTSPPDSTAPHGGCARKCSGPKATCLWAIPVHTTLGRGPRPVPPPTHTTPPFMHSPPPPPPSPQPPPPHWVRRADVLSQVNPIVCEAAADKALFDQKFAQVQEQKRQRTMSAESRLALDEAIKRDAWALLERSQALLRMPCLPGKPPQNDGVLVGQTVLQNTMLCQVPGGRAAGRGSPHGTADHHVCGGIGFGPSLAVAERVQSRLLTVGERVQSRLLAVGELVQ